MPQSPKYSLETMQPVGRYALGVTWGDKHESIFPFVSLRRRCPCRSCEQEQAVARPPSERTAKLDRAERLQGASLMLHWADGHETIFLVEELRELCGCAACKGEPDYPITGQ